MHLYKVLLVVHVKYHLDGSDFSVGVLRKWRQTSIPSLCGILVYKEETSSVTRIALSGKRPNSWSWTRKWVVSLM